MLMQQAEQADTSEIQILVVDDHVLIAETVREILGAQPDINVDIVETVDAALSKIAEHGKYDLIMLDYEVPGMNSLQGLRRLVDLNDGKVAIFSGVANSSTVQCAIEMGASGFFPKTLPLKTLKHAVRIVAEGGVYLPLEHMRQITNSGVSSFGLKPRELRVLGYLGLGMPNKEIGKEIGVEEVIIKMDVKSICRKLDVKNRTQAVLAAQKNGLL
jgi:two-component system, NarL family, nitrate/nitrite response regulator NarL